MLREIGAAFIGFDSGDTVSTGLHDMQSTASALSTIVEGAPLAFSIGPDGSGLGAAVVDAITTLAEDLPIDLEARAVDEPGDGIDATRYVIELRALRASPAEGIVAMHDAAFLGVRPGTTLYFALRLRDDGTLKGQPFARLRIAFVTAAGSTVGERTLDLVAESAGQCD